MRMASVRRVFVSRFWNSHWTKYFLCATSRIKLLQPLDYQARFLLFSVPCFFKYRSYVWSRCVGLIWVALRGPYKRPDVKKGRQPANYPYKSQSVTRSLRWETWLGNAPWDARHVWSIFSWLHGCLLAAVYYSHRGEKDKRVAWELMSHPSALAMPSQPCFIRKLKSPHDH